MNQRTDKDKVGEELAAQRFGMLADIARELAGEVLFPTCFDVVMRLRRELQNPNISLPRVAQIVQLEPLVATKLLRLANSAVYATGGPRVRDLPAAIHRIGLNAVRATALSVAMGEILQAKEIAGFSALAQNLWEHSILCAAAARLLAHTYTRAIRSEEAMFAGLVHDLGAFYMLYRAAQYPELRERPDSIRYLIVEWHEAIGVSLLKALDQPSEITRAATDHDHSRPFPDVPRTLEDVVYAGNLLAGGYRAWFDPDGETREPQDEEVASFREKYAELLPQIEAEAREMHTALG
ncbi:MAG: HDOD domain-containing protein [Candidatus Accumulibacter sp.]|jgi:HD-like signal output (HDOD) protein|nr:HDOD domain-containing protein [Accumulibacter sp.]